MSEALNVTKAAFGGLREVTTSPLWQYDYGQILQITGLDLPQAFEVHFSNSRKSGETITQIGTDGAVTIPDMFLTSGADIYAFIFLHDGTDDGETEYVVKIPVRERPEPSDIEPTPVQQDVITEAIAALNSAVTQTGQDVISADASAQAAAQSATNAQTAATQAQGSATSASSSASTASTAAATASTKASEAATSAANAASAKTAAETAETNAQAAQTASESAQASAESAAQTATSKASEASTYAANASGSASAASASASQASESATQAANSATAASGSATSAATSASTASTKASEASASATAANTAKTAAEAAQSASETAQTEAEAARDEAQNIVDGISAKATQIDANTESIASLTKDKAPVIIDTASGSVASFSDGADGLPLKSLIVDINPVQDLSQGDPSPENLCPISGWTEVRTNISGINVWDEEWEIGDLNVNGEPIASTLRLRSKDFVPIVPNTTYFFAFADGVYSGTWFRILFYDINKEFVSLTAPNKNTSVTIPNNVKYLKFATFDAWGGVEYTGGISINYPSTDHSYHPYTGRSITIDLGQTVYGGTLDVVSGVLTVDRAMVDLGTLTWGLDTGKSHRFLAYNQVTAKPSGDYSVAVNAICSVYKTLTQNQLFSNNVGFSIQSMNGKSVYVYDDAYDDAATFKTAMDGVQLVYELATPITYQLTPTEVRTLLGLNNVWADTGDVEVEYRADTKLYIEKLTQPTEDDLVANSAITSGQFFMIGNTLYRALANIASGATITVGTNATKMSLSDALNALA